MTTFELAVDRINNRAAQVDWRRVILVALMMLPYVLGYTVRLLVRTVGFVVAWTWAAAVEGYQAGSGKREP